MSKPDANSVCAAGNETSLWYALYVKSRHEFVAREGLSRKRIETFLPSARRLRQWKDRRKPVEFPLFPGYLFVHINPDPESCLSVLKTRGAVCFVSLGSETPAPVSPEEINSLRVLVESGKEVDIYPGLAAGARVRVRKGALRGAEGVFLSRREGNTLVVNINILGRSVGVGIYDDDIELA